MVRVSNEQPRSLFEDRHAFMKLVDLDSGVVAAGNRATKVRHGGSDEELFVVPLDQIQKQSIKKVYAKSKSPLVSWVDDASRSQSTGQASRSSHKQREVGNEHQE